MSRFSRDITYRQPGYPALAAFSHGAVWAGLYVIGAVVCLAQVAGIDALITLRGKIAASALAFCTATGVYLLDRVKLRDAWLDPADALAHPRRFQFIACNATIVRGLMFVLLGASAWLGAGVLRWGAVLPLIAAAGVLIYAGRPRAMRPRPKDVFLLKNIYVALGIVGFAEVVVLAAARPRANLAILRNVASAHAAPLALACAYLVVRVVADAVLCDLDDEDADRRFGTQTLPIRLGRIQAWNTAVAIRLCAAAVLLLIPVLPLWPRLGWAAVTVVSSVILRWVAPARVRDWVDARFAIEAAFVTVILCLARSH